jgi:hypothetical protein
VEYLLQVGLYDKVTGERLPILSEGWQALRSFDGAQDRHSSGQALRPSSGQAAGDSIPLQTIHILKAKPINVRRLPHHDGSLLSGKIELLGYELKEEPIQPSGALELTLYWQAREEIEESYIVFTHLLDGEGNIYGQQDGIPAEGMYSTSSWLAGQVVEDKHHIPIAATTPTGSYRIAVGMYQLDSLERLEAIDAGGDPLPESQIVLDTLVHLGSWGESP